MNFRIFFFLLTAATSSAEILTLRSGDRFAGELISISPTEGVLIESPRTPKPLSLTADSFTQLEMTGPIEADPFQTERLVLSNGDILPGNLRALDENEILYQGLVGGALTLSRKDITTLRFGIKPQSLSYQGPSPLDKWAGTGVENWVMSEDKSDGLLMLEPGKMEQNVGLGKQFILKFDLKWQERPAIRIYFGGSPSGDAEKERYYIDLNSGGIQIRRERSIEPKWHTLVSLNQLEAFDDNQVSVELRVNRLIGTIDLYLDGELVRQMLDTAPPTTGNSLAIERSRSDNSASYLSSLQVFSWDAVSQLELLEKTGNGDTDSLVDAEGKRISGTLLGLQEELGEGEAEQAQEPSKTSSFVLKSPFAEKPVKIPAERTRIIYFQKPSEGFPASKFPKYELELANDGLVSATSLSLIGDDLTLEHPILGTLKVARAAVKTIRYYNELTNEDETK